MLEAVNQVVYVQSVGGDVMPGNRESMGKSAFQD